MSTKEFGPIAVTLSRSPLGIIALFVVLVEAIAAGIAIFASFESSAQFLLVVFIVAFPLVVLVSFVYLVSKHHTKLYAPSDFTNEQNFMDTLAQLSERPLVTKTEDVKEDVKVYGDPNNLKLLFKAQGKTWLKSTKALQVPGGCVIQVTTERLQADGSWQNAEALVFVPGVTIKESENKEQYSICATEAEK